jgi:serine/threonine-protein kinase RsbW
MRTATFPGRYENLAEISDFVLEAAKETGLDEKACYAVQTAVDEACSNIIEHAYGGENHGNIVCTVDPSPKGLKVILKDNGKSFNPDEIPDPDLNASLFERKIGGLGLYFMRKFMDEVKFSFSDEHGNQLIMFKRKEKKP